MEFKAKNLQKDLLAYMKQDEWSERFGNEMVRFANYLEKEFSLKRKKASFFKILLNCRKIDKIFNEACPGASGGSYYATLRGLAYYWKHEDFIKKYYFIKEHKKMSSNPNLCCI